MKIVQLSMVKEEDGLGWEKWNKEDNSERKD